jgi:pimeloyl-ACP methyl ester carboxylesterase
MELLQHRYSFDRAHVIAHSMGGLVAREYLNNCAQQNRCDYLQSYTSIASPYAGMASASMGVEYAPSAIPAWIDLSPGSPFLLNLFAEDIPADVRFNLVFAFHNEGIVGAESSDGTVALLSQLRPEAQAQADRLLGIDQTHVGVLDDPAFLNELEGLLVVD